MSPSLTPLCVHGKWTYVAWRVCVLGSVDVSILLKNAVGPFFFPSSKRHVVIVYLWNSISFTKNNASFRSPSPFRYRISLKTGAMNKELDGRIKCGKTTTARSIITSFPLSTLIPSYHIGINTHQRAVERKQSAVTHTYTLTPRKTPPLAQCLLPLQFYPEMGCSRCLPWMRK